MGGTSAGKALDLTTLGARVPLATVLGDDPEGDFARRALEDDDLLLLAETSGTNVHDVARAAALEGCEVAVVDLAEATRPLLSRARGAGKPVWCDVHNYGGTSTFHRPWVDAADVLFLDDDAMADVFSAGFLVATLGGHGVAAAMEAGHRQAACSLRSAGLAPTR